MVTMAAKAATPADVKKAHSPVNIKAIEGMFNGSVTRIAYVFKDPSNFGPSTKAILGETSKRFQDALDDCEIQILDAKWYLEHQLALNKSKREAKAQEDGATAAKRKAEMMKDTVMVDVQNEGGETPTKKQKTGDESKDEKMGDEIASAQPETLPTVEEPPQTATIPEPVEAIATVDLPEAPKLTEDTKAAVDSKREPPKPQINTSLTQPSTSEAAPKYTPQDTPADEAINFESMFGEPSADMGDGGDGDDDFDLNFNADSFGTSMNMEDPSSLSSLLPGLESYAKRESEDNGLNFGNTTNNAGDTNASLGGDFDLPDISNDWDALLNDSTNVGGQLDGADDIMNDNSTINMDEFDSFFNN